MENQISTKRCKKFKQFQPGCGMLSSRKVIEDAMVVVLIDTLQPSCTVNFTQKNRGQTFPSAKNLETLTKILQVFTYSRLRLKALIRSCLFLVHTSLVIGILVLSRVSRKRLTCKTNKTQDGNISSRRYI